MPEYDHDLIAAHAAGHLDQNEAAAAERVIAANPDAAATYALHRRALEAVRAAPRVGLTEPERSQLHMAVATAIGLDRSPVPAPSRRRTPWGAISIAAATLAALVAVVPISELLTGGEPDSAAVTLGVAEVDSSSRSGDDTGAAPMAGVDQTTLATETDGMSTTAGPPGSLEAAPTTDADVEEALTALADDPAAGEEKARYSTTETRCGAEASAELDEPSIEALRFIEMAIGDRKVLVFFSITDGAVDAAAAYAPADCTLLASLP